MMMEAGANAKSVDAIVKMVGRGLGVERVEVRIGYASLEVTLRIGDKVATEMCAVGNLAVNQSLAQGLWGLGNRVANHELGIELTRTELARLANDTPCHHAWTVAVAVGLGCAAFGRLLSVDWPGTGSVFVATTIGQFTRGIFSRSQMNSFLATGIVSFLCSLLAGFGALLIGSATLVPTMIASILLLVPGVPAVNAQSDILEGHPTLGSARAVNVAMTLVFVAVGLWLGYATLSEWH
jgi:uncharacterized membrane protein YjjP (DUF1212 family)